MILNKEKNNRLNHFFRFSNFEKEIRLIKKDSVNFLLDQKNKRKKIVAFGAAHKASTFLNYCKINKSLISHVIDETKIKIGKYMPVSRIPIVNEKFIRKFKPDFVVILIWNLKKEVMKKLKYIKKWNGKFVVFIPNLKIY